MNLPTMGRRSLLATGPALLLARAALMDAAWAADPDAVAPIQALDDALLASMKAGKATPFPQRYNALTPAVDRAFDLPAILQASVGLKWATLPPARQAELQTVFRQFTVASYAANFDAFNGEKLELVNESRSIGADQVVATRIVPASGDPTRIDYVMRRTPSGWKAVDVLLAGSISRVAVQRSDFRNLVGDDGAPLLASLKKKVSDLSGGTL